MNDSSSVYSRTALWQLDPPIRPKEVGFAGTWAWKSQSSAVLVFPCLSCHVSLTDVGGGSRTAKADLSGDVTESLVSLK